MFISFLKQLNTKHIDIMIKIDFILSFYTQFIFSLLNIFVRI